MSSSNRLNNGREQELVLWEPEAVLPQLRINEVRFGLGFLRAIPKSWFPTAAGYWFPLLHGAGVDLQVTKAETALDFPEGLSRVTPVEIDGEIGVIGFDQDSVHAVIEAISPGCTGIAGEVLLDYIERRIVATLQKSWAGISPLQLHYLSETPAATVEIVGNVSLSLDISGVAATVWFGVGPRMMERLDMLWRVKFLEEHQTLSGVHDASSCVVSIGITELAVPPAVLIDCLRPGTILSLETPVRGLVRIKLNEQLWALGELAQLNGKFAVRIKDLSPPVYEHVTGTTRVWVELARLELDAEAVIEHSQKGALLLTNTGLGSSTSLVIGNEAVGSGVLGEIDGSFALHVLPK